MIWYLFESENDHQSYSIWLTLLAFSLFYETRIFLPKTRTAHLKGPFMLVHFVSNKKAANALTGFINGNRSRNFEIYVERALST